jgi:hypothetical protein
MAEKRKRGRPKGTKVWDRQNVVNECVKLRIGGMSTFNLLEHLSDKYNIGKPTGYTILQDAQKVIVEIQMNDIENAYYDSLSRLEELYESANEDKRLKLNIQQEINKLRGLYEPQKVDVTSNGESITQIKLIQVNSKNDLLLD